MMLRMMNPYTNDGQKYDNYDEALASARIADLARQVLESSATSNGSSTMRPLGMAFREPGPYDVICARGKGALNHPGNIAFREMILDSLDEYSAATTKLEKSNIVSIIVDAVRERSPNGGFVKKVDGEWFEVGDHIAREKCGQSFRDLLHTKYKSSTKAKMRKRKNMQGDHEQQHDEDVRYVPRVRKSPPKEASVYGTKIEGASVYSVFAYDKISTVTRVSEDGRYQREACNTEHQSLTDIPLPLGGLSEQRSLLFSSIKPPALDERISASIFDFQLPSQVSSSNGIGFKSIPTDATRSDTIESSNVTFTEKNDDQSPKGSEEGFGLQVFEL